MYSKLVIAIVAVVAVAVVGSTALYFFNSNTATNQHSSVTPATSTSPTASATSTRPSPSSSIEGTWRGNYRGTKGSGKWTWVIKKTGENSYSGCIKVEGSYPTHSWIPVTVELEENKIKIGTVSGAVIFTGTVSQLEMRGKWRFSNNYDQGEWNGVKENDNTNLPCTPPEANNGIAHTTQPSQSQHNQNTGNSGSGGFSSALTALGFSIRGTSQCSTPPLPAYRNAAHTAIKTAVEVFGKDSLYCLASGILGGVQYWISLNIVKGFDNNKLHSYAEQITSKMRKYGWRNVTLLHETAHEFQVLGIYDCNALCAGLVTVRIESNSRVDLTIQIQYAGG